MLDGLMSIVETIGILINFVIDTIVSITTLIFNIPKYLLMITNSLNILPSFLLPFALAFVSLIVVQYILNRRA